MTVKHWQSVLKALNVVDKVGLTLLPKPTDEALDEFEAQSGVLLPQSYRQFIKVFGPGELIWEFRFFAPGYADQPHADLHTFNTEAKAPLTDTFLRSLKDPNRVRRLIFFSRSSTGDLFGWDPEDVRDSKGREYGIYKLGRKNYAEEVAASFQEFIESVVLSESNLHPPKWNAAELGPRNIFDPAVELAKSSKAASTKNRGSKTAAKNKKKKNDAS